ncbi:YciI family protein [Planococcus shixiaomingii]|uniref:YciI family protein n=1 Tax=Planococcus shixiaomingii TaxID=3058393 RepID=UPI0026024AE6|nr:YciI family protein [Planococcus sp. N022]WKA53861.1 YciI family protein [Planococcus sp. N022]
MAQIDIKKFYAVLLPMLDAKKSQQFREEHLKFLMALRGSGQVYGNGRFVDGSGGLVIYMAASYEECEAMVKQDPYIENGARRYEIHEWDAVWTGS